MTQTAAAPSSWSWGVEVLDMLVAPLQQSAPHPRQDAELLQQLSFIPGLKEILTLRQVHALEHATVWTLSDAAQLRGYSNGGSAPQPAPVETDALGGMSTERGFYLYGPVRRLDLERAAQTALQRITSGNWDLAVHPRCGTNLSVGMLISVGLGLGLVTVLPKGPIEQVLSLGAAAAVGSYLAPQVGSLAQKYLTTAIPFNLAIDRVFAVQDYMGRPAHFVQTRWIE